MATSTLFREAESFTTINTLKDVGLTGLGFLGASWGANLIPFMKTAGGQVLKTLGVAIALGFGGNKFLGPREGNALAVGGGVNALFQGASLLSHGKIGLKLGGGNAAPAPQIDPATGQPLLTSAKNTSVMLASGTTANNAAGIIAGIPTGTGA